MAIDFIWYCTKTAAETQSVLDQLVENNKELLNKRFLIYSADEIFELVKTDTTQVLDHAAYRNETQVLIAQELGIKAKSCFMVSLNDKSCVDLIRTVDFLIRQTFGSENVKFSEGSFKNSDYL
jgi:hypothetical protein